jgi:hypothetical protein
MSSTSTRQRPDRSRTSDRRSENRSRTPSADRTHRPDGPADRLRGRVGNRGLERALADRDRGDLGSDDRAIERVADLLATEAGRPLPPTTRREMATRFGHDFGGVRIHDGPAAARSARDVDAVAYTVGSDVVFGEGFDPDRIDDRLLLAHELAHVVQRTGAASVEFGPLVSTPGEMAEREADLATVQFLFGGDVQVNAASVATVARADDPFWESGIFKGLMTAGGMIPGVGGALKVMGHPFGVARGMSAASEGRGIDAAREFGGAATGVASGLAALGGFSMLGSGGLGGAISAISSGGLGTLGTVGGLGASAGATMPASAALTGGGLSGAAALGPAAAVAGAGLGGYALGSLIAENTGVDESIGDWMFETMGPAPDWMLDMF